MSGPITLEIDCLATARRILSTPDAVYSATPFEVVAMAACTVRESTGTMPDLPVIGEQPALSASTASRLAIAIKRWDELAKAEKAQPTGEDFNQAVDAFEDAFNILIARFEKEFPNGSDL